MQTQHTPLHNNPCQWDLGIIFRLRCWTRQAQPIIATMQGSNQLVWLKNKCTQCSWDLYNMINMKRRIAMSTPMQTIALLQSITRGTSWKDTCILIVKQSSRWSLLQKCLMQRKLQVYRSSRIWHILGEGWGLGLFLNNSLVWHILAFGTCSSPSGVCLCNLSE